MNRIKSAPSKMWKDWQSFRNYPGMEYRDVHGVMPGSLLHRFPGPASEKYINSGMTKDYFKWDYKQSYRYSIYFVRRIYQEEKKKFTIRHAFPITDADIQEFSARHPNWKQHYEDAKVSNVSNDHLSLEEKHQDYANLIQVGCETINPLFHVVSDNLYTTYFPVFDNFGGDKNVDFADMDSKQLYIYFDNLQHLYDVDVS